MSPSFRRAAILRSFSGLDNFPPRVWPTCYLSVHPRIGFWVVSTVRLVWNTLLYARIHERVVTCAYFSPLLGIYLAVDLLGQMGTACHREERPDVSRDGLRGFRCLYIHTDVVYVPTFLLWPSQWVRRGIIVVSVCIFLTTKDAKHFLCVFIGHVYIFRKEMYSDPLLIFNWIGGGRYYYYCFKVLYIF